MKRVTLFLLLTIFAETARSSENIYLETALQAARWIRASSVKTEKGTAWPADPNDSKSVNATLYSGAPGVILFFIELSRATSDRSYLADARAGADYLLSSIDSEKENGLYTGLAGIGFALFEVYRVTGDVRYREGALRCAELIRSRAVKAGSGAEWSSTTDIIGGNAGVGLFLLYAAKELRKPEFKETARLAGARLIELAREEQGGLKWAMTPEFPRLMPNFSHGTAGIAYFLATLYEETKERAFLDAAIKGAKYLLSVAKTDGDVCMVFHNEPQGRELFYLGWCHGPVGTARLFYRLYRATGDREWLEWVKRSARAILQSGIPEKQTPGFWNNVSQCCGSAGVADFFLDLYQATGERVYLDFCKRVASQVLSRAARDEKGARWIQAEHRVRPELLVAQTGLMQGASGIGMLMLKIYALERGKKVSLRLPDTPF
ncbi:MAG: lanthionine synthetase LanC family protein [Acidobacteriota bacterium]